MSKFDPSIRREVMRRVDADIALIEEAMLEYILTGVQTTVELLHGSATVGPDEDGNPHVYLDLHS